MIANKKKSFYVICIITVIILLFQLSSWMKYEEVQEAQFFPLPAEKQEPKLSVIDLVNKPVQEPVPEPVQETCTPKKHIGFMKSHKCGSSTVQNIFFRYGWKHNLSFVLPEQSHVILNKCNPFETSLISNTPWHHLGYDMFVQHIIWNTNEVKKLMPPDTVYVQIIRDPVALTESLYGYIELDKAFQMNISRFALEGKNTAYYDRRFTCFGRNQIVFDFGLDLFQFDNETAVKEKIEEADRIFDLVMIAEYYEESMILLKELLCWDLEDVTFLKLNFRSPEAYEPLTGREKMGIREMNLADQMYYDHFLGKFEMKMKEYGEERLKEETSKLKKKNEEIYNKCVNRLNDGNLIEDKRFRALGNGAQGYDMKDIEECVPYARNEPSFTILLREIQLERSKNQSNKH